MARMLDQQQELPYRIEMWDDHDARVEELIALVADHLVARAAFADAVKRRPGRLITEAPVASMNTSLSGSR